MILPLLGINHHLSGHDTYALTKTDSQEKYQTHTCTNTTRKIHHGNDMASPLNTTQLVFVMRFQWFLAHHHVENCCGHMHRQPCAMQNCFDTCCVHLVCSSRCFVLHPGPSLCAIVSAPMLSIQSVSLCDSPSREFLPHSLSGLPLPQLLLSSTMRYSPICSTPHQVEHLDLRAQSIVSLMYLHRPAVERSS